MKNVSTAIERLRSDTEKLISCAPNHTPEELRKGIDAINYRLIATKGEILRCSQTLEMLNEANEAFERLNAIYHRFFRSEI